MMKIGICASFENLAAAKAAGFEYGEASLCGIAAMTDEAFEQAFELARASGLPVLACNSMVPGELKITGNDVDMDALKAYLDRALSRAKRLGVKTIVFGSGGARGVPEGFAFSEAWKQIAAWLKVCDRYMEKYGMTLAIEPLRRAECNILNYVSEALALSSTLELPRVCALGDTFHMEQGSEPLSALTYAGATLRHVHVSHSLGETGRDFPAPGDDGDYVTLFRTLTAIGYEGGVSVEAGCKCFETDAAAAYRTLSEAREKALS